MNKGGGVNGLSSSSPTAAAKRAELTRSQRIILLVACCAMSVSPSAPLSLVPPLLTSSPLTLLCVWRCSGLWAGSGNALNVVLSQLSEDCGLSDSQVTLMTSLGMLGAQFTVPAGWALDKFGRF